MVGDVDPDPKAANRPQQGATARAPGTSLLRRSVIMGLAATVGSSACAQAECQPRQLRARLGPLPPIVGPLQANVWSNPWAPATWDKAGGVYPWRSENVSLSEGNLALNVSRGAAGSVQANSDQLRKTGLFEVDATLPQGLPGLIIAPLYLYGEDAHEIDFEIVGTKGLQLAVHTGSRFNAFNHLIPGDFSGRRRFAIRYVAGEEISWLVDDAVIRTLRPAELASTFPFHALKPYAEIWPTRSVEWAGPWRHRDTRMILHGYRLT